MNIGILMAGGTGNRMAASLPKQFIELAGKPIIMHSLDKFLESGCFDAIYMGIHPDWVEYMENLLDEIHGSSSTSIKSIGATESHGDEDFPPIRIISGGDDRNSTLLNVLDAIENDLKRNGLDERSTADSDNLGMADYFDPIIVTHDSVRPFLTVEMIERSISEAASSGASTVAIPTTDTIASVDSSASSPAYTIASIDSITDAGFVTSVLERSSLYNIQTPQSFRLSLFREPYSRISAEQIASLTDVCGIFSASGIPVKIVQGSPENIKITSPFDMDLARLILSHRE